jgi:glycosyltransferase involved in cell wall biosynthesis
MRQQVLDAHLARYSARERAALPATAVRTRSLDARDLLARAAAEHRDRKALADLARVMVLQNLLPGDTDDALALYDQALAAYGARALSAAHQGLHTRTALLAGRVDRTRELLRRYRRIPPAARAAVELDLINPFVAQRPRGTWSAGFAALMPGVIVKDGDGPAFDRLAAASVTTVESTCRISVVVSAYRPDRGLLTAVRSILAQSWTDVEVLVVDDASPAGHEDVLAACAALDPRVRLIRQPANAGTYVARNTAIDVATGAFVTFQDSDDWSHPRRLERQVRPLLADPALVASTSDGLSATDDLLLHRAAVRTLPLNPSSLMLRLDTVLPRVGYFDVTRKAADSEYLERLDVAFGPDAVHHVASPLAMIRLTPNSLSRAEIRPNWIHPARFAYLSAYRRWHARITGGTAVAYRPSDGAHRPFPAPAHLTGGTPPPHLDVVIAADWVDGGGPHEHMIEEIRALLGRGLRVGVLHVQGYRSMRLKRLPLCAPIQDLINDGTVAHAVLTDDTDVDLLLVRGAEVLQFATSEPAVLRAHRVDVVADRAPGSGYDPGTVTAAVRRIFGVEPRWQPQDPAIRAALQTEVGAEPLGDGLPLIIDAAAWARASAARRGDRPVVGHDRRDPAAARTALLSVLHSDTTMDVRVRTAVRPGADGPGAGWPPTWLVYADTDLGARDFLHQLDAYVDVPPESEVELLRRPILEALAVGCVVVLPPRFAATYGDAAVYCAPHEVADVIRHHWVDAEVRRAQSLRARRRAAEHHDPRGYADRIEASLPVGKGSTP